MIPSFGAHVGTTLVTIFGQFSSTFDYLAFWETSYTSVKTISSSQLEVVTPYHSPGAVGVKLFTMTQQQQIGDFKFVFVEIATAVSIHPPVIAANNAVTVTIKVSGNVSSIEFCIVAKAPIKAYLQSSSISCAFPALPAGRHTV